MAFFRGHSQLRVSLEIPSVLPLIELVGWTSGVAEKALREEKTSSNVIGVGQREVDHAARKLKLVLAPLPSRINVEEEAVIG